MAGLGSRLGDDPLGDEGGLAGGGLLPPPKVLRLAGGLGLAVASFPFPLLAAFLLAFLVNPNLLCFGLLLLG